MKVLVDALGAAVGSGGMRLFAEEVVLSWVETYPEDELVVLAEDWSAAAGSERVAVVPWRAGDILHRAVGQLVVAPVVARRHRVDCYLSLSPVLSPLAPRQSAANVVHDWRHLRRPEGIGRAQRLYRRLWAWSVARAAVTFTVSAKTARETAEVVPTAAVVVNENGRDHARRWPTVPGAGDRYEPYVVTYGHQTNKRPDLVIRAVARIPARERPHLVVLGTAGWLRDELSALARDAGIGTTCSFPGFVEECEYQRLVAGASAVVLASSDEGFGLPIAEACYIGVPAVICDDSGVAELHPGALVARPEAGDLAAQIRAALRSGTPTDSRTVRSWRDHVTVLRERLAATVHPDVVTPQPVRR
ncbi:hypothetical protein Cus16_1925 [Curtobacterium sp. ER1/6]|nr:hypothetical protein Cus16_1925 [Curtobacterium sp. ER1/6]